MEIFDELIDKINALLPEGGRCFPPAPVQKKFVGRRSELILGRETAYELGGSNMPCVTTSLYTQRDDLVPEDQVQIYGQDLGELEKDAPFARIALIRTDFIEEQGEQGAYAILENINLKKYDVYPKGYMVRTSALSNREQVRVSKAGSRNGLSFRDVGSMYIQEYHKNPHVQAVRMIFVTLDQLDYSQLDHLGNLANDMFRALNHIVSDMKMKCRACEWKSICDQVEGMKQMHEKMLQKS